MAVLKKDATEMKEDVAVLKKDAAILKDDVIVLKKKVEVLSGDVAELKEDVKDLKKSDLKKEKDICDIRMVIADFKLAYMERIEELNKTDNALHIRLESKTDTLDRRSMLILDEIEQVYNLMKKRTDELERKIV